MNEPQKTWPPILSQHLSQTTKIWSSQFLVNRSQNSLVNAENYFSSSLHVWTKLLVIGQISEWWWWKMRCNECKYIWETRDRFWPWGQTLQVVGLTCPYEANLDNKKKSFSPLILTMEILTATTIFQYSLWQEARISLAASQGCSKNFYCIKASIVGFRAQFRILNFDWLTLESCESNFSRLGRAFLVTLCSLNLTQVQKANSLSPILSLDPLAAPALE